MGRRGSIATRGALSICLALVAALLAPLGGATASGAISSMASPAGDVVVVTVNAHQRTIDEPRMQELVTGLTTRVAVGAAVPDVIVIQEITQTGLNLLRDKLTAASGMSYGVVGLSSNAGLTSDVKVKLLLNTTTMEYSGRTTWLDVCDSVRLYQLVTARERATGKEVAVAGVHLAPNDNPAGSNDCRERNSVELRKQLAPYDDKGSVIGDFNRRSVQTEHECDPEETSPSMTWYANVTATINGRSYRDAVRTYRRAAGLTMADQWTFEDAAASPLCNGATGIRRMRLDYVFASDVLTPVAAGADSSGWGTSAPGTAGCEPAPACKYSDHRFVWAQLRLPAAPVKTAHVGDLDRSVSAIKNGWRATARILVHSGADAALPGTTVSYRWSTSTGTRTCTTGADGWCTVSTDLSKSVASVSATVTGVAAPDTTYSPAANHDPDGDSDGTTLRITR